ncbi:hypothetical protein BCV70DRAFT_156871 [Testicularia cyperi]|uniref:RNA-dependent RNA polymerase n=1 Tax=Testicularia cyperi TaxID=1882483 RepID=A0A317XVX3_9BASI|nr:hypothetical protein BCV70DRAFT_156871 [Testicularia cyperi]
MTVEPRKSKEADAAQHSRSSSATIDVRQAELASLTFSDEIKPNPEAFNDRSTEDRTLDQHSPLSSGSLPSRTPLDKSYHEIVPCGLRLKLLRGDSDRRKPVPWGVQFYLASLVSFDLVAWDHLNITTGISLLRSESHLESIKQLFSPENQQDLWDDDNEMRSVVSRRATAKELETFAELDREERMREKNPLAGVYGPPGEGGARLYGGQVIFEGRISFEKSERKSKAEQDDQICKFTVRLLPPHMGASCRFARRFGSERFLRLKMERDMAKDAQKFASTPRTKKIQAEIRAFLCQTMVVLGRRFRPFFCKNNTIHYVQVDDINAEACPTELTTVWDFVNHHAPFDLNDSSLIGKFVQRLALGLSSSIPVSTIDSIEYMPDTLGDTWDDGTTQLVMTDGAAALSISVATDIARRLGYSCIPSAFQGRCAGAKGVWYLEPDSQAWLPGSKPQRTLTIRDSQNKIKLPCGGVDASQVVFDLLLPSRTSSPCTLSKQILMVLHNRGVPVNTLRLLQRAELVKIAEDITDWEGPNASLRLAATVDRLGKVETTKSKRATVLAEQRAQGMLSIVDPEQDSKGIGTSLEDDREIFFGKDGRHAVTGQPLSKVERAYEMLLVGYHPENCVPLAEYLNEVAVLAIQRVIGKFAIPVARSAEAMVIPDPTGTLEEDEIQFRFSGDAVVDPDSLLRCHHVPVGDVLVTRHPCLLPTDIRKVRAVVRPELSRYQDVVVFSTKGKRPLASLLSGGDYDGDLIRVFWDQSLVEPFSNADVKYADCPFKLDEMFEQNKLVVSDFVAEHRDRPVQKRDEALVPHLIQGAFEPHVRGAYGIMHLYAAWEFGSESDEAVELAHKFNMCMDGHKTGLTIKPRVRIDDSKKFFGQLPEWANVSDDMDSSCDRKYLFGIDESWTSPMALKSSKRQPSVLCALWSAGHREMTRLRRELRERLANTRFKEDKALSGLWQQSKQLERLDQETMKVIRDHVDMMAKSYAMTNARIAQKVEGRLRETWNSRQASLKGTGKMSDNGEPTHSGPMRRIRSDAGRLSTSFAEPVSSARTSMTLASDPDCDLLTPMEEAGVLTSSAEVATKYSLWPQWFVDTHLNLMDDMEKERLEYLRASYAYWTTYRQKPRFAFDVAWRWMMNLKAREKGGRAAAGQASAPQQIGGQGSLEVPLYALDVLSLRKKLIGRSNKSTAHDRATSTLSSSASASSSSLSLQP